MHTSSCTRLQYYTIGASPLSIRIQISKSVTRTGCSTGPILTIYTSHDVFPRKGVSFVGGIDTAVHLGGQIAPKPQYLRSQ